MGTAKTRQNASIWQISRHLRTNQNAGALLICNRTIWRCERALVAGRVAEARDVVTKRWR